MVSDTKILKEYLKMYLYHYYDKTIGPFRNLSDTSVEEAKRILNDIKISKPDVQ